MCFPVEPSTTEIPAVRRRAGAGRDERLVVGAGTQFDPGAVNALIAKLG
jgi:hypothetical protein